MVCAQLQARLRDGRQRRSAPKARAGTTHLPERAKPKSFAHDGLGSKTQVPCFGCLVMPDEHMGYTGSRTRPRDAQ